MGEACLGLTEDCQPDWNSLGSLGKETTERKLVSFWRKEMEGEWGVEVEPLAMCVVWTSSISF